MNDFYFGTSLPPEKPTPEKPKYDTPGWDKRTERKCVQCGREFAAPSRFVRYCRRCKKRLENNYGGIAVHSIILPDSRHI